MNGQFTFFKKMANLHTKSINLVSYQRNANEASLSVNQISKA